MRKLVLWGHRPTDYQLMFDLSEDDLKKPILEFGCGPSAVNTALPNVTSCDPLFVLDKDTLVAKSSLIFADMLSDIEKEKDRFDFDSCGGLERLVWQRKQGMNDFLADYELGLEENRYVPATELKLPFEHFQFEFALVSHYLFGLEEQDVEFHVELIKELARVAKDVRVFPLIDRYGHTSDLLGPVLLKLQQENYGTEVRDVAYPYQKNGNAMLRVWAQQCNVD